MLWGIQNQQPKFFASTFGLTSPSAWWPRGCCVQFGSNFLGTGYSRKLLVTHWDWSVNGSSSAPLLYLSHIGGFTNKCHDGRIIKSRAFRTRPFRRTRTQTEVRNSDSDSGSDLRNRDFPTPWPKIISQWNTYDDLTIVDICACGL
jgi:hypothetical protein